jgi:hypothetical protein
MSKATKTLFDRPLSHTKDAITSYAAADKMVRSGALNRQELRVYEGILRYFRDVAEDRTFTAKELAYWNIAFGLDYYIIQRRLSGLFHKGKIERLNIKGEAYQENKGQKLMKRNGCCVWRII